VGTSGIGLGLIVRLRVRGTHRGRRWLGVLGILEEVMEGSVEDVVEGG
tara:strand:- start:391 stop:534 length:144 start_codon:yes stop_codon:yes gene_type:complete